LVCTQTLDGQNALAGSKKASGGHPIIEFPVYERDADNLALQIAYEADK
jgi:hypothetical protein